MLEYKFLYHHEARQMPEKIKKKRFSWSQRLEVMKLFKFSHIRISYVEAV